MLLPFGNYAHGLEFQVLAAAIGQTRLQIPNYHLHILIFPLDIKIILRNISLDNDQCTLTWFFSCMKRPFSYAYSSDLFSYNRSKDYHIIRFTCEENNFTLSIYVNASMSRIRSSTFYRIVLSSIEQALERLS